MNLKGTHFNPPPSLSLLKEKDRRSMYDEGAFRVPANERIEEEVKGEEKSCC